MKMKDQTPFQCGQDDAFWNREMNPRMIEDGIEHKLTSIDMISDYLKGFADSNKFYGVNNES